MQSDYNFVTCKKCGHDRNASTLKKCEICGQPLGKKTPVTPLLWIGGLLLLAMLAAGYWFYKGRPGTSTASTPNSSAAISPNPPASAPTATTTTNAPAPEPATATTTTTTPEPATATSASTAGNFELISAADPELYQTFAQISNVPQGTFNYGGSTTFAPLRADSVTSSLKQAHPEFGLRYTEPVGEKPGSGAGIKMLIDGQLSFAQSSRPVKDKEFAQAEQRGFKLEQVPVAIDGIAFYVNPGLSVSGLTLAQIKDIFTGKITNWQEVGGPNVKITPFSRNAKAGGTVDFFVEGVLEKQAFGSSVQEVRDTTQGIREVAKTSGGIGYATASEVVGQETIRSLPLAKDASQGFVSPFTGDNLAAVNESTFTDGSYPLTRRLFVIIKRDRRLDEQAGVAYANMMLSKEGQALVEQAGFVPLH